MSRESGYKSGLAGDIEIAFQHYLDLLSGVSESSPERLRVSVSINLNNDVYVSFGSGGKTKRFESLPEACKANIHFASLASGIIVTLRNKVRKFGASDLHEKTGISRAHIYKIINMESSPTLDMIIVLSRALDEYAYIEAKENSEDPETSILSNCFKFDFK